MRCNTEIEIDIDKDIDIDIEIDKEKDIETREEKRKSGVFTPPTLAEVQNYCHEKDLEHINAESFIDFYESKGWMVGKNKMKDWKAAARNWDRSEGKKQQDNGNNFRSKHESFMEMWRNA